MRTSNSDASPFRHSAPHSNSLVCLHVSPCSACLHLGRSPAIESRPRGPVGNFLSCWFPRAAGDALRPSLALQTHLHLWPLRTTSPTKRASRTHARTPEWRRRLSAGPPSLSVRGSQELRWAENSLMQLWWHWKRWQETKTVFSRALQQEVKVSKAVQSDTERKEGVSFPSLSYLWCMNVYVAPH